MLSPTSLGLIHQKIADCAHTQQKLFALGSIREISKLPWDFDIL
jgi:hypothetical protein